jgi:hypothetical protein
MTHILNLIIDLLPKKRVELVNTALFSYQKSKDSRDAGPICIVRPIEAKEAGVLDKFED